jgi:membrane fusion protein
MQSLQAEERQALSELETHQLRLQLARKTVERQQQLANDGFVAAAQVQSRQEELLDIELRVRNAERNLQALTRDRQGVNADLQALVMQIRANLEQLDRTRAALDQEAVEADGRNGLTVTATKDGHVSAITLEVGQSVQPGQTLLSLVPKSAADPASRDVSELQAQLFAPSRTSAFVRTGQKVWLRYAGFPYQKFGMASGEVIEVSRSPIAASDLPAGQALSTEAAEALYRITVRLSSQTVMAYGQAIPLTTGMRLDADILQEQRRIWEWLLEPVLSIAKSGIGR